MSSIIYYSNLIYTICYHHIYISLAEANNRNAYDNALTLYKSQMDTAAGAEKPFMKEGELQQVHDAVYIAALTQFDEIATMGEWIVCVYIVYVVYIS